MGDMGDDGDRERVDPDPSPLSRARAHAATSAGPRLTRDRRQRRRRRRRPRGKKATSWNRGIDRSLWGSIKNWAVDYYYMVDMSENAAAWCLFGERCIIPCAAPGNRWWSWLFSWLMLRLRAPLSTSGSPREDRDLKLLELRLGPPTLEDSAAERPPPR